MAQQNPVVQFGFEMRDDVSAELQSMNQVMANTDSQAAQLGNTTERMGTQFTNTEPAILANSQAIANFSSQVAIAATSINQLADAFGLIPESMQKTVSTSLAVVSATASLISVIAQLNQIERVNIALRSISNALSGPVGLAVVAAALATGVAAAAAVSQFRQASPGQMQQVPGNPAEEQLVRVHGGEFIGRPNNGNQGTGQGGTLIINNGTIVADEGGMRDLARRLSRFRQEENRVRGTEF